jgi:hypothetical protein
MGFTTYDQWMKDTNIGKPRSNNLLRLDDVLKGLNDKAYSGALTRSEFLQLQDALFTWKKTEVGVAGKWESSSHNRNKAVEKLQAWVDANNIDALTRQYDLECKLEQADQVAQKAIADAIRDNTRNIFLGRKLTLKTHKALADVLAVRGALNSFKTNCANVKSTLVGKPPPGLRDQVEQLVIAIFGDAKADEVLGGTTFGDILTSVTPFVASIKTGSQGLFKWIQAAMAYKAKKGLDKANASFAPGDPAAAFDAILRIQQREIDAYKTSASINTVTAVAQAAFAPVDFGTVSGPMLNALNALAQLAQKMFLLALDENEIQAATKLLKTGPYDLSLFKASPLLGCYLIGNSDTSAIINMAVGDYGKTGWMLKVEDMVKKAQPVFDKSRAVIIGSRYEIVDMRTMKGQVVNWNERSLKGLVPSGKITGVIHAVTAKIDAADQSV